MTLRAGRLLLTAWGAAATAGLAVELVRADALGSVGPGWTLAYLATYVAGVWASFARPENRAALWLLLFGCAGLTFLATSAEVLVRVGATGDLPIAANLVAQTTGLMMVGTQAAALVRYPDGEPILRAERWLVTALLGSAFTVPVLLLLSEPGVVPAWVLEWSGASSGTAVPTAVSPWHQPVLGFLAPVVHTVYDAAVALGPLLAVAIVAARYRRMAPEQRRRMAWPLLAALILLLGVGFNALAEAGAFPRVAGDVVELSCYTLLPISMAIGITAPGLFDALGTARRTVSFAALSLLILGVYVAAAGLLGVTVGGDDLRVAVVVAVLAALALEPARRTLVRHAGRLAYGHEISRDELLLRLGDTLEHTMDRRALTESIAETAMEGLGAQWIRLEPGDSPAVHVGREIRHGEKAQLTARLRHGQDDLGAMSCGPVLGGRASRRSRIQFATLARQVAMALTNARLADELNAQLAEIEASRQRLVTAEETARRRLERDLHDGAQQDIAALLTRIALAQSQLNRSAVDKLGETLATLRTDAGEALQNLRELVSGIHETTLADQGLVSAVEGRASKLPIPVAITCGPEVRTRRLDATIESAAYFTVCEALANTLKHSAAESASIDLNIEQTRDQEQLQVRIADDGRGFDPGDVNGSQGLVGLRDRITAIGGTLDVRSAPGAGTTLIAVVPVP